MLCIDFQPVVAVPGMGGSYGRDWISIRGYPQGRYIMHTFRYPSCSLCIYSGCREHAVGKEHLGDGTVLGSLWAGMCHMVVVPLQCLVWHVRCHQLWLYDHIGCIHMNTSESLYVQLLRYLLWDLY